jgi:hypothetical protein
MSYFEEIFDLKSFSCQSGMKALLMKEIWIEYMHSHPIFSQSVLYSGVTE